MPCPTIGEGDLVNGRDRSATRTLIERTTRFTTLLHLPPMSGYGPGRRDKHELAVAGYGAESVGDVIRREDRDTVRTTARIVGLGSGRGASPPRQS